MGAPVASETVVTSGTWPSSSSELMLSTVSAARLEINPSPPT